MQVSITRHLKLGVMLAVGISGIRMAIGSTC
jgi:hypothetical protein